MMQPWKVPHLVKGALTYVPFISAWRSRHNSTGGSDTARYCYAVWLRHLIVLNQHGFDVRGSVVAELGPGDSIGTGLAALLSGARRYVGLDLVAFSAKADLTNIVRELEELYLSEESVPDHHEFPGVRPRLASYDYPGRLIDLPAVSETARAVAADIAGGLHTGSRVGYIAPWTSVNALAENSLDLIFSQAVLQFVDGLEELYRAMFTWLKPGGYCSHSTGCSATYLSPFWNGHWAYSDLEWRIVRGRRPFLHNRAPASAHALFAQKAGFEVLSFEKEYGIGGLPPEELSPRFRTMNEEDLRTRGIMMILRKPR